jgi:Cytochrome P450
MMILMDPPDHTRLRKLVSRSFTLRRTNDMRPRVEEIAKTLLDGLPADRPVDLVAGYAAPLPVQVICELLGVPMADRADFTAWSTAMVDQTSHEETTAGSANLFRYLGDLIDRKRGEPDDALLSALIEVSDDGDRLSREELVAMGMLLLIAGHETSVNLVGNALLGLLIHPDQRALLRARPDLTANLVEEVLRWDSPVQNTPARFTTEPVEMGGVTIPAGVAVVLSLAAANRDPDRFPGADELRIDRAAQGHVAFGHGLHHCLGAQLARIEAEVAIGVLLARFPDLELAVDAAELVHRRSTLVRGLTELPAHLSGGGR